MTSVRLSGGVIHALPKDLRDAIVASVLTEVWKDITPLARNEWICWVEDAKREETRTGRIRKAISKLGKGMRRPCCWAGCPHRPKRPSRM
jgi:uncharacterized protein YdeI (YjbR/CyaY-like superfamily)